MSIAVPSLMRTDVHPMLTALTCWQSLLVLRHPSALAEVEHALRMTVQQIWHQTAPPDDFSVRWAAGRRDSAVWSLLTAAFRFLQSAGSRTPVAPAIIAVILILPGGKRQRVCMRLRLG